MAKNILHTIEHNMPAFSKGQKRIACYILEHTEKAASMTAVRLGKLADVSESTVVRFAAEVGCAGYPELQRSLREALRSRLTAAQRFRESDGRFAHLPAEAIRSDLENMRRLAAEADSAAFEDVVDRILTARHVYLSGVRSSWFVAGYLHFYLHLLLDNVTLVQSNAAGGIFEQLFRIGPGDVLLAFSFPRYSQATVNAVQFARDRGAAIIAVTDNALSPVYALSDARLLAPCEMISFVDSMAAPLSLMNALIVALARRLDADAAETFSRLEEIWNAYGVFGKPDEGAQDE